MHFQQVEIVKSFYVKLPPWVNMAQHQTSQILGLSPTIVSHNYKYLSWFQQYFVFGAMQSGNLSHELLKKIHSTLRILFKKGSEGFLKAS
jgi:hypothetical protein